MWARSREDKGECLEEEGEDMWYEEWIVRGSRGPVGWMLAPQI